MPASYLLNKGEGVTSILLGHRETDIFAHTPLLWPYYFLKYLMTIMLLLWLSRFSRVRLCATP